MRSLITVAACAIALGGCAVHASPPSRRPNVAVMNNADIVISRPAVEKLLQAEAQKRKIPGLAFGLVSKTGLVYFIGVGARDTANAPVTLDTVYRIGSITKTISSLALLALRDEGKLNLDDPVSKYLPEASSVKPPTTDGGPITVRHLVTHTSGLPRLGKLDYGDGHEVTRDELIGCLSGVALDFAPGSQAVYSNLAMALVGLIVAKASGQPFRDFVNQRILTPLGMKSTVWDPFMLPMGVKAQAWAQQGDGFVVATPLWRLGAAESMGGLYSSIADMSRYVAFQLNAWPPRSDPDPFPVRRATVREAQLIAGFGHAGDGFGVNWIVKNEPKLGYVIFHNGGTEGFHASLWMLPDKGIGVIALGPATDDLDDIAHRALDTIYDAGTPEPPIGASAKDGLDKVKALLAAPAIPDAAGLAKYFAQSFLDKVPPPQLTTFLGQVRDGAGNCTGQRVTKATGDTGAQVELICTKKNLLVNFDTDPAAHLIRSLGISFL